MQAKPSGVQRCPSCQGLWIAGDVLASVLDEGCNPETVFSSLHGTAHLTSYTCPHCRTSPLQSFPYHEVEIDCCKNCRGIFLDRGEYDKFKAEAILDSSPTAAGEMAKAMGAEVALRALVGLLGVVIEHTSD